MAAPNVLLGVTTTGNREPLDDRVYFSETYGLLPVEKSQTEHHRVALVLMFLLLFGILSVGNTLSSVYIKLNNKKKTLTDLASEAK